MIEVELPDGRILDVDTDDPNQAAQAARKFFSKQQQNQVPVERKISDRTESIPEISKTGLKGLSDKLGFAESALSLVTFDPQELGKILTKADPDIGVVTTPEGETIAVNNKTKAAVSLNKPGLSLMDVLQFGSAVPVFTPAGAASSTVSRGLPVALARGAAATAGTQATIESAQALSGGEFSPGEVAFAGASAPAGQVVGEKLLSPLARAVGGKVDDGIKSLLNKANELNIDILTTDVLPPQTFAGRTLQHLGEKLGLIGTGGRRAAQQRARVEIVEGLAQEMGVTLDQPIERDIFESLSKGVSEQLNRAGNLRSEAVKALDEFGVVPVNKTLKEIDKQIVKQERLRADASQEIINRLNRLKDSIQDADFSLVKDLRSNLIDDVNAAFKGDALPNKAVAPLQAVKASIDDDLLEFASSKDIEAAGKWVKSNKIFADGYRKAKDTEVKRLLKKGEGTPEVVSAVIRSGKTSELNRMRSLIGDDGKKAAQLSIMRDALVESGFFTSGANPDRFITALSKPSRQRAVNVFFKGSEKNQIEGVRKVLEATRRAQEAPVSTATGQQLAAPVAAIAGAQFDAGLSLGSAAALGGITRLYERSGTRNLLLRLANTKRGSKAEKEILDKVIPYFQGVVQGARSEINASQTDETQEVGE